MSSEFYLSVCGYVIFIVLLYSELRGSLWGFTDLIEGKRVSLL